MDLPDDSIGISDIIDWQECPRRMSYKMQRHTDGEPPEAAVNWTKRFGSAFHDGVEHIEASNCTDDEAIQFLMANGHRWMQPEDMENLKADFATYRTREPLGVRTVWNEHELRVPLFVHEGRMIYFRGRIDRLYQSLSDPSVYYHRDYKASNWPKTQDEVDDDPQMESYNFAIFETLPQIGTLVQTYDQLHFGEIEVKQKTDQDRERRRQWLITSIKAILEDDEFGPDGLLVPEFNRWCRFCPIMESCAVIPKLSRYALAEIASVAPAVKEGRSTVVKLDPDLFDIYIEQLEQAMLAQGVLERYVETVKAHLAQMPKHEREAAGFALRTRSFDVFSVDALKAAHQILGDERFYRAISLSKMAVERVATDTEKSLIVGMTDKRPGKPFVVKKTQRKGKGRAA